MGKKVVVAASIFGGLALCGGIGYGAWYAWDNGLIPGNPRAPTLQAMEQAVRRSAEYRFMTQPVPCIAIDQRGIRPELQGIPGIANRPYPGQYAVTYLVEGSPQMQESRDRTIQQHRYLARQGLYTEADVSVDTDAGPRAGKEFRLTWKGFVALGQEHAQCFNAGARKLDGIGKIEKGGDALGFEVWDVSIQTSVAGAPAWLQTAEGKALFPRQAEATVARTEKVRLTRGKEGWLTEHEMLAEAQAAQLRAAGRDGAVVAAQLQQMLGAAARTPDEASVRKAFDEYLASEQWQSRSMAACLPLHLQRGGDDRGAQLPADRSVFAVTWYDAPPSARREHERGVMLTQLHVLSALEAAGLAAAYRAPPGTVNGESVANGLRFVVKPEAVESLGLAGGGCMTVGRINKIEYFGSSAVQGGARISARGEIGLVQPWATALAESLPALKTLLAEGVPFAGQVQFAEGYDRSGSPTERKWRVSSFSPALPQIQYTLVPAVLQPHMPHTLAATKPVKAPLLLPGLPQIATPAAPAPSASQPSFAPPPVVAAAPPPPPAPPPAPVAAAGRKVPYWAGNSDVHVVSVYQGQLPGGAKRGFREHPEGFVDVVVKRTARPVMLFLSSYEPVEWRVKVEGGGVLARVVAIGYYDQRVTVSGPGGVPVATHKSRDLFAAAGFELSGSFPREATGNKAVELTEITTAITGKAPTSFQGDYGGTKVFTIDGSSPVVELPQAKSAASSGPGKVVLQGSRGSTDTIGHTTVKYGGAGAFTEAWASRGYSTGKVYFEATIAVVGGGTAKPHANVGVAELDARGGMRSEFEAQTAAIKHGEQDLFRSGDVFGLAVDYDEGVMYVRVNGQWLTGQPGSGMGKRFRVGRGRAAYLYATGGGNSGGEAKGSVSWDANFGAGAFRDAPPTGFIAYDGSRR